MVGEKKSPTSAKPLFTKVEYVDVQNKRMTAYAINESMFNLLSGTLKSDEAFIISGKINLKFFEMKEKLANAELEFKNRSRGQLTRRDREVAEEAIRLLEERFVLKPKTK